MNKKIVVIFHSADFDGIFCREAAKRFYGDRAEYIGWDFKDKPLDPELLRRDAIVIMDLPVDRPFGFDWEKNPPPQDLYTRILHDVIWIDHHKSSIDTHPTMIPGYRIDGVAACRLAWQWFRRIASEEKIPDPLPTKSAYIHREVVEPMVIQMAGEYDIWDDAKPEWKHITALQLGLRAGGEPLFGKLLSGNQKYLNELIDLGMVLQNFCESKDAYAMESSFLCELDGLKFLALNSNQRGSIQFASKDKPETGHDALLKFSWDGSAWDVSLYHARHRKDLDLSVIARKFGGGGHRGACGFRLEKLTAVDAVVGKIV